MPQDFKQTIKYKVLFRGGQLSRKLFGALVKYRNFGLLPASGTRHNADHCLCFVLVSFPSYRFFFYVILVFFSTK